MFIFFFFNDTATTEIYTLSLHDALPILPNFIYWAMQGKALPITGTGEETRDFTYVDDIGEGLIRAGHSARSEEHTSELQSPCNLVCRLLLEKKKIKDTICSDCT